MSEKTETTKPEPIEMQLEKWSATRAEIATLAATADGVTVNGHADGPKAGRDAVHNVLMPIWRKRCEIDARAKQLLEIPKEITAQIKKTAQELSAPLLAAEDRLRKDRDDYDAEQERIKAVAAEAAKAKRQQRINESVAVGIAPNLDEIDNSSDEEWNELVAHARAAHELRQRAISISSTLFALGDPCTEEEAAILTDEQAEHRIAVARKAQHDRDEAERLRIEAEAEAERKRIADQAEADRLERVRLESVAQRVRTLAGMGGEYSFADVEAMDDDAFCAAKIALQDAADRREEQRKREALGMERARILSALGDHASTPDELAALTIEQFSELHGQAKSAKDQRDQETAQRLKDEQDRQDAQRVAREAQEAEAERLKAEALKPQKDAVRVWAESIRAAIGDIPESVTDDGLRNRLRMARNHIDDALSDTIDDIA